MHEDDSTATEGGPTTYTTKAGNLWVWTLGASADVWVRQVDRARHLFAGEFDTDALEAWDDGPNAVDPFLRLGVALGLKGALLVQHPDGRHVYKVFQRDGSEPVHLFVADSRDGSDEVPTTVVPALESLHDDAFDTALEAILSVVEAKPETATEPPWLPGAPIDRTLEYEVRRIDGYGGLFCIRADAIGWSSFSATSSDTFSPNGWSSWECRPLPAGSSWWSTYTGWACAPEHPNAAANVTPRKRGPTAAIDRLECLVDRQLEHMEATGDTFVRCDDAAAFRDLTAAWVNLRKVAAGPA